VAQRYLTVPEVAERLGVGRSAVNRAIERKRIIPAYKAAGAYWIKPADVEKYRQKYSRPRRSQQDSTDET